MDVILLRNAGTQISACQCDMTVSVLRILDRKELQSRDFVLAKAMDLRSSSLLFYCMLHIVFAGCPNYERYTSA